MNLKQDLLNKFNNEKYLTELELFRLAESQNMSYKIKLDSIQDILDELILINTRISMVGQYFVEQQSQTINKQSVTHQGQTHGEWNIKNLDLNLSECLDNFSEINNIVKEFENNFDLFSDENRKQLSKLNKYLNIELLPEIERLSNTLQKLK